MTLSAAYQRSQGPVPYRDVSGTLVAIDGQLVTEKWTDPSTIDDDGVVVGHAGVNTTTASMTIGGAFASGGIATLTFPRAIIVTVTHGSAVVAESGVITGYDAFGNLISEAWSVTAGGTSKTYTTGKAFKKVTAITETSASDASANTVKVGDSKRFGLHYRALNTKLILELEDATIPTVGTLVAGADVTVTDRRGTYTPNSAPNGALDFTITYMIDVTKKQFDASVT